MEAAVAEKEAGMTEWNDGRLDDLSERVDRIEKKMDDGFASLGKEVREGFARINDRFDGLYKVLFNAAVAFVVGILGLLGVVVGLIATKM